jgi:hypothetical protein
MQVHEVQRISSFSQQIDQDINASLPLVSASQQALHVLQQD